MKNMRNRTLRIAIIAALLCIALFTTTVLAFAWTSIIKTASTSASVNTVEAGTFDVALEMYENEEWIDAEGKSLNFSDENGNMYWEPGGSYTLPSLRIVNTGNIDLSYTLEISGINGDSKLEEVVDWYYVSGDSESELTEVTGTLASGESTEPFNIKGIMSIDAGNEYQGLTIEGIAISVSAKQTGQPESDPEETAGLPYFTINTNEDVVIDEKGRAIVLDDTEQNYLASENGQKITLSNCSFTGTTEALLFGQYRGPNSINYNNEVNNVQVKDLHVLNGVANGSDKVSIAVYAYGNSVFNNCIMTGTTSAAEGYKVYDFGSVNGTKTTINGGEYGAMYIWSQAHVTINNAEVDRIDCATITTRNLGMLTIGEGTHIGTIDLTVAGYTKYKPALTILDGASVDEIIYKGISYTQDEWINNNPL